MATESVVMCVCGIVGVAVGRAQASLCLTFSSDKTLKVHLVEDKQVIRSAAISNLVHPSLNVIFFYSSPLSLSFSPFLSSFPPSLSFSSPFSHILPG